MENIIYKKTGLVWDYFIYIVVLDKIILLFFYQEQAVITGQNALAFSRGVASTLAMLRTDVDSRIAALLFELPDLAPKAAEQIEARFGAEIADLVTGTRRLLRLREAALTQHDPGKGKDAADKAAAQMETLRKMVLAIGAAILEPSPP